MSSGTATPEPKRLNVLVVEDELILAMFLEERLQEEGCRVLGPASRQARALALLERETPDVALLDLNLDGERPIALAERLVARGVPFVIMTGYDERHSPEAVLKGAPRLRKPFRWADLMQAIGATTGRTSMTG